MGNRLMGRDAAGRPRVELQRLPRWMQLLIASAIVGVVVALARRLDPRPRAPRWLPGAIRVSGWVYLGVAGALLIGWAVRRVLSRADRSHGKARP